MSITCGKKARKRFGNRYAIKKAWRRRNPQVYRTTAEREKEHREYMKEGR